MVTIKPWSTWVVLSEVDEVVQTQHTHATEVCGGVGALEPVSYTHLTLPTNLRV